MLLCPLQLDQGEHIFNVCRTQSLCMQRARRATDDWKEGEQMKFGEGMGREES